MPGVLQRGGPELILLPNYNINLECSKTDIKQTQITLAKYFLSLLGAEAHEHIQYKGILLSQEGSSF